MYDTAITDEKLVQSLAQSVLQQLKLTVRQVPIGISNRHIHLSRTDMESLFGPGSRLTCKNLLVQPGQYASEETVALRGPKGQFSRVRVLGPLRPETQVEISVSDGYTLGLTPPVRDSGKLEGSPGIEIIGPRGSIVKQRGVIVARRHIHMDIQRANLLALSDKQIVEVEIGGARGAVLKQVLIRVSRQYLPEMHLDLDEANGLGVKPGTSATIIIH